MNIKNDSSTMSYLLGDLGIEILALIAQGCHTDDDILRLGSISESCLAVKIPLLESLGLIRIDEGKYYHTEFGSKTMQDLVGWAP